MQVNGRNILQSETATCVCKCHLQSLSYGSGSKVCLHIGEHRSGSSLFALVEIHASRVAETSQGPSHFPGPVHHRNDIHYHCSNDC